MTESAGNRRYYAVRWTWNKYYTLDDLRGPLKDFTLTILDRSFSWFQEAWGAPKKKIMEAKADTLTVWFSAINANLFQKRGSGGTFTPKDKALRDIVFELYPHWQSTPIAVHPKVEYWRED